MRYVVSAYRILLIFSGYIKSSVLLAITSMADTCIFTDHCNQFKRKLSKYSILLNSIFVYQEEKDSNLHSCNLE